MNNLTTFTNSMFGDIRTTVIDGKILFCGHDVAKALGYSNTRDAISRHCKGVVKYDIPTNSGTQSVSFITEGDVYRLIIRSKLPSAEKFESWIFDEVLPQIRKTGGYIPVSSQDDDLTIMAKAHQILERTLQQKETIIQQQSQQLAVMQPKADSYDMFLQADGYVSLNKVAKSLHKGRNKMMAFLRSQGVLFKDGNDNIAYQRYCSNGCFTVNYSIGRDGLVHAVTKASPKGVALIKRIYDKQTL